MNGRTKFDQRGAHSSATPEQMEQLAAPDTSHFDSSRRCSGRILRVRLCGSLRRLMTSFDEGIHRGIAVDEQRNDAPTGEHLWRFRLLIDMKGDGRVVMKATWTLQWRRWMASDLRSVTARRGFSVALEDAPSRDERDVGGCQR